MNFQEFVIPSVTEEDSNTNSNPFHQNKMAVQSTCIDSSVYQDDNESSLDIDQDEPKKSSVTRLIRKKYDPIVEGNRIIKYEDDPVEYKKARKRIQNRLSAIKVRGKKKTELEILQVEVQELKAKNSQLTLYNSKLEGENSILKERVNFLEKVVLKQEDERISSFISTDHCHSSHHNYSNSPSISAEHEDYNSPFQNNEDSWFSRARPSSPNFGRSGGFFIAMTLILAVVIMPSSSPQASIMASKISDSSLSPEISEIVNTLYQNTLTIQRMKYWGKLIFVGIYLGIVSLLVYNKRGMFIKRKKTM